MAADRDQIALIHALAELAGRPVAVEEAELVLERARHLCGQRANEIWSQYRRAPATVSLRDYLAMTVKFIGQDPPVRPEGRSGRATVDPVTDRDFG